MLLARRGLICSQAIIRYLRGSGVVLGGRPPLSPTRLLHYREHKERELPLFMLVRVHEKMSQKLEGLRQNKPTHMSSRRYEDFLSDSEGLVGTLHELIGED